MRPGGAVSPPDVRVGVDLGGTKIEAVALDRSGAERFRARIATPPDYRETLHAIAGLVARAEEGAGGHASVGIGIPGAVSRVTGRVKNANATWLNGEAFVEDVSAALAREVRVENDANCLAVSEATDGSGAGLGVVFAVILGTGVGAGVAIGGRAHAGPNRVAGEWGHNPLPWPREDEAPGPPCYCGAAGCIETWLSGPALARQLREAGGAGDAARVFELAAEGDMRAGRVLEAYLDRLARALSHVVNVLDPDAIVLGGGVSRQPRIYEGLGARMGAYVFGGECATPVLSAKHGDASGVRGAAWLWPR